MEGYTYIAAFDLDKTILDVNSSSMIVKASRKMGLMSTSDFIQAIYYSIQYKLDLKDANKIVSSMTQWLRGLKESDVQHLIDVYGIPKLLSFVRPEILEEIAMHRKKNAKVIILSSALSQICIPIAKHLGMDDVVSSHLEVKDGAFTGKSIDKLVFGPEKEVRMKQYCLEHGLPLETAYYYGDAFTDRFVLGSVGNPVCVKPELKLKNRAKKRGWRII